MKIISYLMMLTLIFLASSAMAGFVDLNGVGPERYFEIGIIGDLDQGVGPKLLDLQINGTSTGTPTGTISSIFILNDSTTSRHTKVEGDTIISASYLITPVGSTQLTIVFSDVKGARTLIDTSRENPVLRKAHGPAPLVLFILLEPDGSINRVGFDFAPPSGFSSVWQQIHNAIAPESYVIEAPAPL